VNVKHSGDECTDLWVWDGINRDVWDGINRDRSVLLGESIK